MSTNLETRIREKGQTIRQFSMASGVPYATLYDVVKGKRTLDGTSARHAQRIAKTLGLSVEELLDEKPPTLTPNEADLLTIFRSLPPYAQRMLLAMARNVAEGVSDE